jgi:hypothetical protein
VFGDAGMTDLKKVIEIKAKAKVGQSLNKLKANAARAFCSRKGIVYEVLTEEDLMGGNALCG